MIRRVPKKDTQTETGG
jgi:hypothetical protein